MSPVIPTTLLLLTVSLLVARAADAGDLPSTIARIKPAVVGVGTFQRMRQPPVQLRGTGFVVGNGRYVITNAHVLPEKLDTRRNETLAVFAGKGKRVQVVTAKKGPVDHEHDLAVLQLEGKTLPALKLGDSTRVQEGELYAFTGFPIGAVLGLHPATHRGIVSAITPIAIPALSGRQLDGKMIDRLNDPYDVFQLDATAYPGNSGSPLFDPATGEVVGVINKVFVKETKENLLERPSGITYAIPISYAKTLLKKAGLKIQ